MGMACGIEIKRETFDQMNEDAKLGVLYDYLDYLKKKMDKVEEKAITDRKEMIFLGSVFGFVGGAAVWLGKYILALF
jgi:hypothetical protein